MRQKENINATDIASPGSSFAVCHDLSGVSSHKKNHSMDLFVPYVPQSEVPDLILVSFPVLEALPSGNIFQYIPKACWVSHLLSVTMPVFCQPH